MKNIIVTGGAGFIGSAVIRQLINNSDHTVVNLDKLTYAGNLESLQMVDSNPRYHFEHVDICDPIEVQRVFEECQPDIFMHLAAESHVDRSIDGPAAFIQANIVGTCTLLAVMQGICDILEELVVRKPISVRHYRDLIRFVQDRPGHDRSYSIDAIKIRTELGWVPKETFETCLRKTIEWYLDNQAWYKRVHDGSYLRERLVVGV
jgi:dTDP-D-glucose 4,6-dehydratase